MYVGLKQRRGDEERYVTPARAAAKETIWELATLLVRIISVEGEKYMWIIYIWTVKNDMNWDMINDCSYAPNLSSYKMKAWKQDYYYFFSWEIKNW